MVLAQATAQVTSGNCVPPGLRTSLVLFQFKMLLMRLDPAEEDSDLSDGRESPVGDPALGDGEVRPHFHVKLHLKCFPAEP